VELVFKDTETAWKLRGLYPTKTNKLMDVRSLRFDSAIYRQLRFNKGEIKNPIKT